MFISIISAVKFTKKDHHPYRSPLFLLKKKTVSFLKPYKKTHSGVPLWECLFRGELLGIAVLLVVLGCFTSWLLLYVIFWVVPLPRIPVTTRIIVFLVGDPNLNLHLPLLLGGGTTQVILDVLFHCGKCLFCETTHKFHGAYFFVVDFVFQSFWSNRDEFWPTYPNVSTSPSLYHEVSFSPFGTTRDVDEILGHEGWACCVQVIFGDCRFFCFVWCIQNMCVLVQWTHNWLWPMTDP